MEISQALAALAAATNSELYDNEYQWMVGAVETHETLDQFVESSAKWNERTSAKHGEIAGFKFVAWSKVQVRRGDTRQSLSVIDFGDVRFALDTDLTNFV